MIDHVSTAIAAGGTAAMPAWSVVLFVIAGSWWLGFFLASIRTNVLRVGRRFYWIGYSGVACFTGLGMLYRGWRFSLIAVAVVAFYTVLYGLLRTPYVKVGGRLFAASEADRRRDERDRGTAPRPAAVEDYETVSPAKTWWILVFFSAAAAAGTWVHDHDWRSYIGVAMILLLMPFVGSLDGRGRFPVARRQYVQAVLVAVTAIPLYGAPVMLYAAGYFVGRRLPVTYDRHYAAMQQERKRLAGTSVTPHRTANHPSWQTVSATHPELRRVRS